MSEYFNEDDELDDYVDLINIAADEWMRGDLETRKEREKIGLASDEKGSLVIQDVQEIPHEFRQQGMIITLMNFHCSSWVHDIDEWESTSDPTWQTLACQILNQMPELVEDASREYDHILRKCMYNTPMAIKDKQPLHNEIIRIYEPKHQHAGPLNESRITSQHRSTVAATSQHTCTNNGLDKR